MSYLVSDIAGIIHAKFLRQGADVLIEHLITDSRKLLFPESALFFALPGSARSGKEFIKSIYDKGVRNFVTGNDFFEAETDIFPEANFLQVADVLAALQSLAAFHRHRFHYPVIGITGSNGKTIVKEWLNQLQGDDYNIIRSPKSYNSQAGVPLSVWRMNEAHTLGIFESGISQPGEMEKLQKIIDPEIGIVTFIGSAHAEGFESIQHKIREKVKLFKNSKQLIYCNDDEVLQQEINTFKSAENIKLQLFTWGLGPGADVIVKQVKKESRKTNIFCSFHNTDFNFTIPFTDEASVNNALCCCCVLLCLNLKPESIAEKMQHLRPVEMRMELKKGINNCSVINDGYSADINSLSISLDFLEQQQQHAKRTVILSDFLQSGQDPGALYSKIAAALSNKKIHRFIGIGTEISLHASCFNAFPDKYFFASTELFLDDISKFYFENETILLKGARIFQFEKISKALEQKSNETSLEINLNALRHNINVYRQLLKPGVKMMAMVKAFSYGSGSFEIANLLQHAGVDYLAVAYPDEGADLRRTGITLPVMVMNTEASGFDNIVKYNLEPEIFSFNILDAFCEFLRQRNIDSYPVHIKIDTGMHRLGFIEQEIPGLCAALKHKTSLKIISVFSHLAGSDSPIHDDFTRHQGADFTRAADDIEHAIGYGFIRHIANSSAIYRHPGIQMDMVRVGIGLYGVDALLQMQQRLQPVTQLRTTISQIKNIKKGESVGYSRRGIALQDSQIAVVRIGYADGYPRNLSNGKGKMLIKGNFVPVIGNVCMDMTMLDVTGTDAEEGDTVIVFGEELSVTDLAGWADTIPYEILTNISQRVKRVYFDE